MIDLLTDIPLKLKSINFVESLSYALIPQVKQRLFIELRVPRYEEDGQMSSGLYWEAVPGNGSKCV